MSKKAKTFPIFLVITALLFEPSPAPLFALEQIQSLEPHSPKSFPEDLTAVSIPEEIGKLTELHRGRRPETLILVQDAHAIPDAQSNIQKLIGFFQESYGVKTVTLEGAKGSLDTTFLRAFPQPEILKKTLERYLEESELSAGNAAALLNTAPARYAGVEPWELYEKGTLFFLEALEQDSELEKKTREEFQKIELEKDELYPAELRRIDKALSDFRNERTELGSLLQTLSEVLPPEAGSEIEALTRQLTRSAESASSRNKQSLLESEVRQFARVVEAHLEKSAPSPEIKKIQTQLNEKIQAFQTSRLSVEEFGLYLTQTAEQFGIQISFSGNLQTELGFARKLQQIEGTLFFDELERYAERVKNTFFTEDSQRLLDRESAWLELADRLRRLSLSHKDWEKIESLLKNDSTWIEGPGSTRGEARFAPLMRGMKAHLGFYETALARDRHFIQETLKLMRQGRESSALFISGGFHSQGLTHLLRQEGYSYLLVTPAVKSLPRENLYHKQMRGEVSWAPYFENKTGKVNLYEAFQRGARERLLDEAKNSGIAIPALIKEWRDEIIRQLASEGHVSSAANYTRFLDEISKTETASDPMKTWGRRVQQVMSDLNFLHSNGRLTPENVLQTANRSLSAQAAVYSQQSPVLVDIDLLPGIASRAELRSEENKPVPENKGSEIVPARALITQNSLQELALRAKESQAPAKPAGFLSRMIQTVKGSVSKSVIAGFKKDLRREDRLYHHWFLEVVAAGPDAFISIVEEVLNPAHTDISPENRGHVIAYLFSRRWAPKGAEYYALSVLPRLSAEDFIHAYLRGTHTNFNEEVFEMLLEFNTPDSKRILTEIARSSEWPNVRKTLNHVLIEAAGNKDRESTSRFATEILQAANRVDAGKSYEKLLEIFIAAAEVEGLYTEMPTPSLADLRRLGNLPFEVIIFPSTPNTVIVVKGAEASVSAVFPGADTRGMSLHNHPPYSDGSTSPIPSGYPTRGVYGSEDYRGDLILVDSSPHNYIVTQNGIARYYIDPAPEKPAVPFKMDLYFNDGSMPQVMEARAKGDSKRHYFDHKDPLLFDSTGKPRDFLARGMLGPNNQSYNIQFFTWETLLRDFSEGRISSLLDFLHPNLLDLLAHSADDYHFLANDLITKGTPATRAEEIRQALTEQQARMEEARAVRGVPAAAPAAAPSEVTETTALSLYEAPPVTGDLISVSGLDIERNESYGELISGLGELFTSEQRLRTFLNVMLQTDYPKAIEFAKRHLGPEHSPQIRRAVIIGLANGAAYLQPNDTAFFIDAAMSDSDFRVREASLELLKNARLNDEDILRFIQRAGKLQINTTRIVLYAGEMQLSKEAKKAFFLLMSSNSESYRRFLAEAFSGDLFNYAPVHFYISLNNAKFSSADNTEILSQVFENLSSFEISGLFNSPFSANNIIDRFKLDDADLETLISILERRGFKAFANTLKEKLTDKPMPDLPPEPVLEAPTVSPEYEDPEWRPLQLAKKQLERKTIQIVRESDRELKKALMAEWVAQAIRLAPTEKEAYGPGSFEFFKNLETFFEEAQKISLESSEINAALRPVLDKLGPLGKGRVERARDHVVLKTGAVLTNKEDQYKFYSEWLSRWIAHVRAIEKSDLYNGMWEANKHFEDFFTAVQKADFSEAQNAALLKNLFGKTGIPASNFRELAPLIHLLNLTAEDAGIFYLTFHKSGVDFLKQTGFGAKKSLLEYSAESSLAKNPALLHRFLKTLVQEIPAFSSDAIHEPLRILLRTLLTAKFPVSYDNEILSGLPVFSGTEEGIFLGAMQNNGVPLPESINFIEGVRLRYPELIASIQLYAEGKSIQISENAIASRLSLEGAGSSLPELPALPVNTTRNELRDPKRPPDFSPYGKPLRLGGSYFNADGQEIRIVDNITLPFQYARSDEFGRRFILFAIAGLTFRIREMTRAEEDRYLPGAAAPSELDPGELAMAEILPYTVEIYDAAAKSYFTASETFFESSDESGQSKSLFIGRVILPEGIMNLTDSGYMGQRPVNLEDRPGDRPADNKSTIVIYDELDPTLSGRYLPYRFFSSAISRVLDTPDLKTFVEDHRGQSPDYVDSSAYQRPGHVEIAIVESPDGPALKITDRGSRNGTEVPLSKNTLDELGGESELSQRYNPVEDNLNNSLILSADSLPEDDELDSINWGILNRQRKGREITPGSGMRFQPKFPFRVLLEDSQTQSAINLTLLFNPENNTFHLYDPFDSASLEVFDFSKPLIYQGESLNLPIQAFVEELKTMPGKKSVRLENTDTTGRWKIFIRDARSELRAEASEQSAQALIESLNPAARKPLTQAQAEVISFLGNLNYDAFAASVESAWTNRSQTGENTLSDALVRTIQAESDALRRHLSETAKDFDGIISLGLATRAGSGSFLRQLIGLLEESGYPAEVLAESSIIKELAPLNPASQIIKRSLRENDWAKGIMVLRSTQKDVPVALDGSEEISTVLNSMFNGLVLSSEDIDNPLISDYAELLFAASLIELAKIMAQPEHQNELLIRRDNPLAKAEYLKAQLIQQLTQFESFQSVFSPDAGGILRISGQAVHQYLTEMAVRTSA